MSQEERQRKKEEQQAKEAAAQVGEAAREPLSRSILLITCSTFEVRVTFDRICLEMSQGEFDDISKKKTYIRGYLGLKVNGRKLAGQRGFRVLISRNAKSYTLPFGLFSFRYCNYLFR